MPKVALSRKTKLKTKTQDPLRSIPMQPNYVLLRLQHSESLIPKNKEYFPSFNLKLILGKELFSPLLMYKSTEY